MHENPFWLAFGLAGQALFFMRFFYQWLASEAAKRSVVPELFWYFSMAGGAVLLIYSIYKVEWVFIVGQAGGLFIYSRNIYLIRRERRRAS